MKTFTQAIVRPPCPNFADGITSAALGAPSVELALEQHERYCNALERVGINVTRLQPDENYPDSTFVEDTAVLVEGVAIITNPGAASRAGEVDGMAKVLESRFHTVHRITAPGTVDGGDVCEIDERFVIGISERTNEEGARQLSTILSNLDYSATTVDIRGMDTGLLHLKSGLSYLGSGRLLMSRSLMSKFDTSGFETILIDESEEYAANCLSLNDHVIIPTGFPKFRRTLELLDYKTIETDMSEFQKMDGGLTCLSLRF